MTPADLDAVLAIEADSFPTAWQRAGYEHELIHNDRASYWILSRNDAGQPEQIIGYAGYWLVAGEAHISIIAVSPAWRGHGLGELLLLQLLSHALAAGAGQATLEVRERNQVAQALYQKYGFTIVGRRTGYYKDTGEDALLMTLTWAENGYRERLQRARDRLWQRLEAQD